MERPRVGVLLGPARPSRPRDVLDRVAGRVHPVPGGRPRAHVAPETPCPRRRARPGCAPARDRGARRAGAAPRGAGRRAPDRPLDAGTGGARAAAEGLPGPGDRYARLPVSRPSWSPTVPRTVRCRQRRTCSASVSPATRRRRHSSTPSSPPTSTGSPPPHSRSSSCAARIAPSKPRRSSTPGSASSDSTCCELTSPPCGRRSSGPCRTVRPPSTGSASGCRSPSPWHSGSGWFSHCCCWPVSGAR